MALADSHPTTPAPHITISRADRERIKAQIIWCIQEYLRQHGCKEQWLLERAGVTHSGLWRILTGKVSPNEQTLRNLATVIGPELLIVAGYKLDEPAAHRETRARPLKMSQPKDRELGLLLGHLGQMNPKAQQIIKYILREDYHQLLEKVGPTGVPMDKASGASLLKKGADVMSENIKKVLITQDFPAFDFKLVSNEAILRARSLIREFDLHRNWETYVDIGGLLTKFEVRLMEDLPASTWGFTLDLKDKIIVALNDQLDAPLLRFVAMHEIGHVTMWHPDQLQACVVESQATYDRFEAEATTIAALVLVPRLPLLADLVFGSLSVEELAARLLVPPALVRIRHELYFYTNF